MTTNPENANESASSTSAAEPLCVVLTIDYRNLETRTVALPAIMGRVQTADVCLDDLWISHIHCLLDEIDGTVVVRDLGSKNGIFVNGRRVNESSLQPGDSFTLGITEITVTYQRGAVETTAPSQSPIPDTCDIPDATPQSNGAAGLPTT